MQFGGEIAAGAGDPQPEFQGFQVPGWSSGADGEAHADKLVQCDIPAVFQCWFAEVADDNGSTRPSDGQKSSKAEEVKATDHGEFVRVHDANGLRSP